MSGEIVFIGDYYIEKEFLGMVYNEVKEKIATENRIDARRRQRKRNERRNEEMETRRYFCNQKFLGGIYTTAVTVGSLLAGSPLCLLLAIPGIYAMVTKKMVIVNDYWYEHGGAEQDWLGKEWKWMSKL